MLCVHSTTITYPPIVKKFNFQTMNFLRWRNDFEFTIILLEVYDKRDYLLKKLEPSAIQFLSKHVRPYKLFDVPYEMLISILEEKYSPLGIYKSLRKRSEYRTQFIGESVQDYYNTIKNLICKYHNGPQVDEIILRQFLVGLINPVVRVMLQSIPNLTLGSALYIAKYTELVENPLIRT